jgi:hypothetical protein
MDPNRDPAIVTLASTTCQRIDVDDCSIHTPSFETGTNQTIDGTSHGSRRYQQAVQFL